MGEIGIPFDLDEKRAYRTGDFRNQSRALDRSLQALEANLLSATLWDYTSDNTNARGDLWNDEDFSIFSRDQQTDPSDPDSGGRALDALLRPYPQAVAGEPLAMTFDRQTGVFMFSFAHDSEVAEPTILYVPRMQYPGGCRLAVSDGEAEYQPEEQRVVYRHSGDRKTHTIRLAREADGVSVRGGRTQEQESMISCAVNQPEGRRRRMATSVTCYGGVGEIGGNKILLEDAGRRVMFDFGKAFGRYGAYFDGVFIKERVTRGLLDPLALGLVPPLRGLAA